MEQTRTDILFALSRVNVYNYSAYVWNFADIVGNYDKGGSPDGLCKRYLQELRFFDCG